MRKYINKKSKIKKSFNPKINKSMHEIDTIKQKNLNYQSNH